MKGWRGAYVAAHVPDLQRFHRVTQLDDVRAGPSNRERTTRHALERRILSHTAPLRVEVRMKSRGVLVHEVQQLGLELV